MKMNITFLCFLVLLAVSFVLADYPGTTILTKDGYIDGTEKENHYEYLGIPYAEVQRFEKPANPIKWNHIMDTKDYGPICPQPKSHVFSFNMSENCLTLNVFVPKTSSPTTKYEVMFWIHGGAFRTGSGRLYDPSQFMDPMSTSPKIVVTINYRLGAFGFLQAKQLGNFGLYDQVKALQWVRSNIGQFLGDPEKITVFGESAGGFSTAIMFLSQRLNIKKAIVQSGIIKNYEAQPSELKNQEFSKFLQATNCDSLSCLNGKSMDDLLAVSNKMDWLPTIDPMIMNGTITEVTNQLLANIGNETKHIVIGSTHDEWNGLLCKLFPNQEVTPEQMYQLYLSHINAQLSMEQFQELVGLYVDHFPNNKNNFYILSRILNDWLFHCPQTFMLDQLAKLPSQIYSRAYRLDLKFEKAYECGGVTHAMDIPYLFPNTLPGVVPGQTHFTEAEKKLSDTMVSLWASFAGNTTLSNWPQSTESEDFPLMLFNSPLNVEKDIYHSFCAKVKPYY